jgi:antitoxin CcdA
MLYADALAHQTMRMEFDLLNATAHPDGDVARAVAEKRAELWVAQNQKAFECWNAYVEKNGLPLGKYRSF